MHGGFGRQVDNIYNLKHSNNLIHIYRNCVILFLKSPFFSHYQIVTVLHFVPLNSPIAEQYEYLSLRDENNSKKWWGTTASNKTIQWRTTASNRTEKQIENKYAGCLVPHGKTSPTNGACNWVAVTNDLYDVNYICRYSTLQFKKTVNFVAVRLEVNER